MDVEFDENKDYYGLLGLKSDCSLKELKASYIQLAMESHPDTADPALASEASVDFRSISEAWAVLSKPETRKQYDASRRRLLHNSRGHGARGSGRSGGGGAGVHIDFVDDIHDLSGALDPVPAGTGSGGSGSGAAMGSVKVASGYSTQKINYDKVRRAAVMMSTLEETRTQYKDPRWHKLSLSQRKKFRSRPVRSFGSSVMGLVVPVIAVGGVLAYTLSTVPKL